MAESEPVIIELKVEAADAAKEAEKFADRVTDSTNRAAAGATRAGGSFSKMGALMTSVASAVGAGLAALAASVGAFALSVAKNVAAMKGQADELRISTDAYQQYAYAASVANIAQSDLNKGFASLNKILEKASLGAEQPVKIFKMLGIEIRDANGKVKDAATVLPLLADRLNAIPDPAQRAATATLIFGDNAAQLEPLLSRGSAGIDQLRDAAERLGIVLSQEEIQRADEVAQKLHDVKVVLEADISAAVARNADAILKLAETFVTLTENVLGAIEAYSNFKAIGIFNSPTARLEDRTSAARALMSSKSGRAALINDVTAKLDENVRNRARGTVTRGPLVPFLPSLGSYSTAASPEEIAKLDQEYKRLNSLRNTIIAKDKQLSATEAREASMPSSAGAPNVSGLLAPKPRTSRGRKPPPDRTEEIEAQFYAMLTRLNDDYLAAVADTTLAVEDRLKAERTRIESDRSAYEKRILADEKYTEAQKAELVLANNRLADQRQEAIKAQEAVRLRQQALAISVQDLRDQDALLQLQGALAGTREEARDIDLRRLDIAYRMERAELQEELTQAEASKDLGRIAAARKRLADLEERKTLETTIANERNESPLERYRREVGDLGKNINESLEQVEVDGLKALNDGLVDAITGAKSLGDVFKQVANQIIADLVRIAVQQAVIKPLASMFGGGGGGGGSGIGGIISTVGSFFGGGFASGGYTGSGPENQVAGVVHKGEFVVPANAVRRIGVQNLEALASGNAVRGMIGASAARPVASQTIVQVHVKANDYFDARVASISRDVAKPIAQESAASASAAMGRTVLRAMPARMQQYETDGV